MFQARVTGGQSLVRPFSFSNRLRDTPMHDGIVPDREAIEMTANRAPRLDWMICGKSTDELKIAYRVLV